MKSIAIAASVAISLTLAMPAQAALQDEGNGQLYDNVTGVVWQQNANLAATNTFGVSGIRIKGVMAWNTANSWIAAMNAADYLGHNDWMLPTTSPVNGSSFTTNISYNGTTDVGYNITSPASQLSNMYYVNLGLKGLYSPSGATQSNYGIFGNGTLDGGDNIGYGQKNVGLVNNLLNFAYWSGTAYAPNPINGVWGFTTEFGGQDFTTAGEAFAAWAVRPGTAADIAAVADFAANVPEPESYAMLLAGLAVLGAVACRRKTA